uniref:uncharacterized protein LOC122607899 n=1 Tax=Erigeron canadensis TaxID=72917 RepID=UPI001CB9100F|nr:uncharacterized protein LOC122607899 [Erigeron canadensis]
MARSFSNAKRLSSFFTDHLSVSISKRGIAATPQGGAIGGSTMTQRVEESSKPAPKVPEFSLNQVNSAFNYIRPFSSHANIYKSQIPSMLSLSSKFSTAATASVASHARPLSPHLSIYKPQSNSMISISNRIAAMALSAFALAFYLLCMKTGLICFTYYSFYQIMSVLAGFTGLICYTSVPLIILHIIHSVKH